MKRYRSQIKDDRLPQAYGQNFVDGAATGVNVAGAWGRLGETIQKAGEIMKRRQDEWDATRAMEANNAFMKRMTAYMDDPDTGVVNTRKLGLAQGVTKQADTDFDRFVSEIERTLDNDAQKQAFRAMAERSRVPFWKQASHFEAAQVNEYRGQVFKNTLDAGMQMVMRDPMDEGAFETAAVQGATAIRAQYVGADEKVVNAAIAEYVSGLEAARIAAVSEDNPLLGEALIKSSPYLTPMDAKKLRGAIGPKAEIYRRQEAVDKLVQRFGPGQEQEGLAWIREHKSGEEEERLASAYKQRIGEMTVDANQAERLKALHQRENYDRLFKEYIARGKVPPAEMTLAMLYRDELSNEQWKALQEAKKNLTTRAQVEMSVREAAGSNQLSPEEFEAAVMRRMGTSEEEYRATFAAVYQGVMNGSVTDENLDYWFGRGKLPSQDVVKLKNLRSTLTDAQKSFFEAEKKSLEGQLKELEGLQLPPEASQGIRDAFLGGSALLDIHDPEYRKKLFELKKQSLVDGIEKSGVALDGFWGRSGIGVKRDAIIDSEFGAKGVNPFPLLPRLSPTPLDLSAPEPRTDVETADINAPLMTHSAANAGKKYLLGGKKDTDAGWDCSGLVCSAVGGMLHSLNRNLGYEAFGPEALAAIKGQSADIIENVSGATGVEKLNPVLSDLRPGMIVGLNAGTAAGGRGYKGIDHVGVVIAENGALKIYEANAKQNVVKTDAGKYLDRYKERGVPIYLVDPMLMMQKRPFSGKDGIFGIPAPPKKEGQE